jgi:ArsR family transcriptional regulator, arsenate/arsenite/antimonite-responsive transcriptional repressor / arsenate reductase (thioredoxin)
MAPSGQVAAPPAFVRLVAQPLRWTLLTALADSDYRVRELVARVDQPQNLVSYHLRLLRGAGLVTATRSSFDGRDSYYHLDLDRCAAALAATGAALHPASAHDTDQASYPAFQHTAEDIDTRIRHLLPVLASTNHTGGSP